MPWPVFGVIAAVAVIAAWWLKAHGDVGVSFTLPSGFGSFQQTIHMSGFRPFITLQLPQFTQGSPLTLPDGTTVAPAPYFETVTLNGVAQDVSQAVPGSGLTVNLTTPTGTIVATYKESVALGAFSLQGVVPDTTCTITYGP